MPNCFEIQALLYQVMVQTNLDGRTDVLTHGRTHKHRTKIVTTMSRLPASGLDKNVSNGTSRATAVRNCFEIYALLYMLWSGWIDV